MMHVWSLEAVGRVPRAACPDLKVAMWNAWGQGDIDDDEAQRLAEAIDARGRVAPRGKPSGPCRSPNPSASVSRRRRVASAGFLPPDLAQHFTVGEQAALSIIASEVARHGSCCLPVGAIAARSGTSATTVRLALRKAAGRDLVHRRERRFRGRPSMTTVVKIVGGAWIRWLGGRQRKADGDHQSLYLEARATPLAGRAQRLAVRYGRSEGDPEWLQAPKGSSD